MQIKGIFGNTLIISVFLDCPDGWDYFSGSKSCYKVFTTPMSWNSAQKFCQSENSALASISNSETNSFLTTLTTNTSWIGGYRSGSTWRWIDGSSWGYTSWSNGNPNNEQGVQDKTSFNWGGVGKWDDDKDTSKHPFICRVGASGILPPSGKPLIHWQPLHLPS